jgi:hypothetical protein
MGDETERLCCTSCGRPEPWDAEWNELPAGARPDLCWGGQDCVNMSDVASLRAENARLTHESERLRGSLTRADAKWGKAVAKLHQVQQSAAGTDRALRERAEAADAENERLRGEVERLTRRIECAPPWPDDRKALDDEQMCALLLRWSTGPERYQADADALIATTMEARRRAEAAEQLAADRLTMLDVAVRNASEAANEERLEIMKALWDLYGSVKHRSKRHAIEDAIRIIESRNPAPAGEEVRDGES